MDRNNDCVVRSVNSRSLEPTSLLIDVSTPISRASAADATGSEAHSQRRARTNVSGIFGSSSTSSSSSFSAPLDAAGPGPSPAPVSRTRLESLPHGAMALAQRAPFGRSCRMRRLAGGVLLGLALYFMLWTLASVAMPHTVLAGRLRMMALSWDDASTSATTNSRAALEDPNKEAVELFVGAHSLVVNFVRLLC